MVPLAVYLFSNQLAKTYRASTTLHLQATSVSSSVFSNQLTTASSTTSDTARLISTTTVGRAAAKDLGEPASHARSLASSVSAQAETSEQSGSTTPTSFLTITATAGGGKRAADIANAFAAAVIGTRSRESISNINRTIAILTKEAGKAKSKTARDELETQLQQLRGLRASQDKTSQVVERAVPPGSPISPNPKRNASLGFIFAILLAAGLVAYVERLDRRVRGPEELEEMLATPLLALVPEAAFPGRIPGAHVREAFQTLRASLTYFNVDHSIGTLLVTSPTHGDGKTTVSTNLAIAYARDGQDVVLVDGDLRRPRAAARVGAEARYGLETVLLGEHDLQDALIEVEAGGGRLRVLPGITTDSNPSVLLNSQRMRSLLTELSEHSDLVIIDTPPLLAVSDAIPLLEAASGIVMVARVDYTKRDALIRARQVIETARGKLLGVVSTGTHAGGLYGYDRYGYGYDYAYMEEGGGAKNGDGQRGGRLSGILRRARRAPPLPRGDEPVQSQHDRPKRHQDEKISEESPSEGSSSEKSSS